MADIEFKGRVAIVTVQVAAWGVNMRWPWRPAAPRCWSMIWAAPWMAAVAQQARRKGGG